MPKLSGAEYLSSFEKFLSYASSKGCTSLHDCGIGMMGVATDMQVILETFKDPTPVRYSGYLSTAHWDEWMKMKMKPNSTDK
jgi:hypothetical protein